MKRLVWTTVAIVGALLVETALSYLVDEPGRYLDPFLLVVVYCALTGGESHGMLAGMAAGWVQDVHFGGEILGLSALSKLCSPACQPPCRAAATCLPGWSIVFDVKNIGEPIARSHAFAMAGAAG